MTTQCMKILRRVKRSLPGRAGAAALIVFGTAAPAQRMQAIWLARQRREVLPLTHHVAAKAPLAGRLQHSSTRAANLTKSCTRVFKKTSYRLHAAVASRVATSHAPLATGAPQRIAVIWRLLQSQIADCTSV